MNVSTSPSGSAISGGYTEASFTGLALIVFFTGLSMYNAVELILLVFLTFERYRGLYFWSLLVASAGIVPYSLGFLFKFFQIATGKAMWLSIVLLTIGWWSMVTGQSVVLWSRLHLVVSGKRGTRILRWTKWMIIVDFFILHIPTTILTFGCNGSIDTAGFLRAYGIYEKLQMAGFFVQELILSSIYVFEVTRILRTSLQPNIRKLMYQLIAINIIIILMDIALLGLESADLYIWEIETKSVIYSIKLKLELAVLSKLVRFVGGGQTEAKHKNSAAFMTKDDDREGSAVPDFVDPTRLSIDYTHARSTARVRKSSRPSVNNSDLDLARFEHLENSTLDDSSVTSPSPHCYNEQNVGRTNALVDEACLP